MNVVYTLSKQCNQKLLSASTQADEVMDKLIYLQNQEG